MDNKIRLINQQIGGKAADLLYVFRQFQTKEYFHSILTAYHALTLCEKLGQVDIRDYIVLGALFHDIGKLIIPDEILNKKGPLDSDERFVIELHPNDGVEVLKENGIWNNFVLEIVGGHHELLDGTGYPIHKEFLSLHVHIVTIADIYEALTSARSYKSAYTHQEARLILDREAAEGKLCQAIVEQMTEDVYLTENSKKIIVQTVDEHLLTKYYERHDKYNLIRSLMSA